ncbi:ABC transporter permease [Romboutsia sp. Marseille-P6047]|uniref:ABC transporter permease n=1 Tax=Romboutsia sp. Marseille-P6047 TaxID=2161817 RepID=UPI001FAA4137|nr:ABC transporter permease [Romboutsia sp. Marseille-P6047]
MKELHKKSSNFSSIAKNIIDNYHEELYFSDVGTSFIESKFVDSNISKSSSEYFAISLLGFLIISMIFNNTASGYDGEVSNSYIGEYSGLNKRIYSMPISRVSKLILSFVNLFIYSLIFLILYVFINRFLGTAFTGNIFLLIIICLITSIFIASISKFISSFIPKKYGVIITCILSFAELILGGTFVPFYEDLSKFYTLSPTHIINNLFTNYSVYDNFSSISTSCILILLISSILFILSAIKEKYHWREI